MKVCVISPFINGNSTSANSTASKNNILDFIDYVCDVHNGYDFIFLAGYNAGCYPNESEVKNVLQKKHSTATVFIETCGIKTKNYSPNKNAFFVSASNTFNMPEQIFSKQKEIRISKDDVLALQKYLPQRFHTISNKKILLLICGEIDAFTIKNNIVHNQSLPWNSANIIINPTFTIRRRWNILGIKLSNLSQQKRIVIHNANNDKNHTKKSKIITDMKVFLMVEN